MGLLLTTTAGLVLWIVLWAIDFKAFDGFMITLAFVVFAATAQLIAPHLPGNRPDPED
jgi:hypothetical protein